MSSEALSIVEAFLEAANEHDIVLALSLLDETYVFRESGSLDGLDRDAMKGLLAWDTEIDSQARYQALEVHGEEIRGLFSESNLLYRRLGIPRTDCRVTFRVRNGRIVEQIIEQVLGDGPTFDDALEPFFAWAEENAPEELEELQPDGLLVFTRPQAKKWKRLLDRWEADGAPGRLGSEG